MLPATNVEILCSAQIKRHQPFWRVYAPEPLVIIAETIIN